MKSSTLLVFSLSLICSSLWAQSAQLQGDLTSTYDQSPLVGAALFLEPGDHQTITDARGRFSFENLKEGNYTLSIRHLGFAPYTQAVSVKAPATDLFIHLDPRFELMQEARVSGRSLTGGERGIQNLSGSAHYLGVKSLEAYEYNDVNRLLRKLPGVYIQEEEGFGLRPNIGMRGTGVERSSKITLMEDGVLAAPAPYSAPSAYYFPTTGRMEGIEVRKGSSQIEYGPYTTGGALNLISTQIPKEFRAKLDLLAGSFGQRRLHAHAGQSFTNFGFMVETYQAQADGFKELDFGGPTGFDIADYQLKFRLNSGPEAKIYQALELKLGQTINNSDETYLGLSREDYEADPFRRYASSGLDHMATEQRQYQLNYRLEPMTGLNISATAYYNEFNRNWYKLDKILAEGNLIGIANLTENPQDFGSAYQTLIGAGDDTLYIKNNNRAYYSQGIQTKASYAWGDVWAQSVTAGLRYHEDGMDRFQWNDLFTLKQNDFSLIESQTPGTESNRLEDAQAWAAYGEYQLSWNNWTFNPGLRYENITMQRRDYGKNDTERLGSNLSERENQVEVFIPGFGLRYDFNRDQQIFAGVHRGFSPPGSVAGSDPELSINTELGTRWNLGWSRIVATLFYNDYQNLLGTDMAATGGVGTSRVFNGGGATVYGLEAEFSTQLGKERSSWTFPLSFNYTFTQSAFENSFESDFEAWGEVVAGDELPYLANHLFNLQLEAQRKRLSLNASLNFQSAMRTIAGQGDIAENEAIPAQFMIDLSGTYHLNNHLSLFASVRNLSNETNLVSMRPAGLRPAMPRAFLAGIKARW